MKLPDQVMAQPAHLSHSQVAAKLGVSSRYVKDVRWYRTNRERRREINSESYQRTKLLGGVAGGRWTPEQKRTVKELLERGMSYRAIAERMGVGIGAVSGQANQLRRAQKA